MPSANSARPYWLPLEKLDLLPALQRVRFVLPDGIGRGATTEAASLGMERRIGMARMKETQGSERSAYCTGTVPLTGMPPTSPVMVNEVIPAGTVILSVVEDVPFAIRALGGTTPLGLLDR